MRHYKPNIGYLGLPHRPSREKMAVLTVRWVTLLQLWLCASGKDIGNYSCAAQDTQTGSKNFRSHLPCSVDTSCEEQS
uniref:cadherin EGF LAG seven-pass G-type receptor 1 n=1 Tax=Macaca mulatta TaxID=9544 RepID=UPI0010A21B0A|nr:cadherin EGF LAG seven-pass G-type receptor 1 [Macaca mulatta]